MQGLLLDGGLASPALLPLSGALGASPSDRSGALLAFGEERPEEMVQTLAGSLLRAASGGDRFLPKLPLFEEGCAEVAGLFRSPGVAQRRLAGLLAERVHDGKSLHRAPDSSGEAARVPHRRRNRRLAAPRFFALFAGLPQLAA